MKIPENIKDYIDTRLKQEGTARFHVPLSLDLAAASVRHTRPLWRSLGRLETLYWEEGLEATSLSSPLYVCGLARSGSTILLQKLYETDAFSSALYTDYPFIDIPLLWQKWLSLSGAKQNAKAERTHLDRLEVSVSSPEALEEMIWMDFFKDAHTSGKPSILDEKKNNPAFEAYYKAYVKKIVFRGKRQRYLAKGNYNLTRMAYIRKIFPDARFIIALRKPEDQIASLMKQHYLFCTVQQKNKRALRYMQTIGHFEFGLDRRFIHTGNKEEMREIANAVQAGDETTAWALYYKALYGWLYDTLNANAALKKAVFIVPYETLCVHPAALLKELCAFAGLPFHEDMAAEISAPAYYQTGFSKEERSRIETIAAPVYERLIAL